MRNKIICLVLPALICFTSIRGQTSATKKDPVGRWKFEAPYAPEGYSWGTVNINFVENRHSAFMTFTGMDFKFPAENVKLVNDSLFFNIYIEGQDVLIKLKQLEPAKMSGNAFYSEGIIPLTLTREEETQ